MPLFEYECRKCGELFEALVVGARTPVCPKCKSQDLEKRVSSLGLAGVGAWSGGRSSGGCSTGGGGG
jgi:putative FmdB family regulatory protein